MNSHLTILLGGLIIACLPIGLIVYGRTVRQLTVKGGRVRSDLLDFPDALVALVLGGFFAFSAARTTRAKAVDAVMINTDAVIGSAALFLIMAVVLLSFVALRKIDVRRLLGLRAYPTVMVCLLGVGFLAAAAPIVLAMTALMQLAMGGQADEQVLVAFFRNAVAAHDWRTVGLIAIVGIVIQPAVEEVLFRGYFYAVGKRYLGGLASAVITAALFAAVHDTLAGMLPLLTIALCFTIAFEATGSILAPFVMHALFNGTSLAFLFWQASAAPPP